MLAATLAVPMASSSAADTDVDSHTRHELTSKRTETSQTFQNPDGSLTTEISTQALRFKDDAGKWAQIDTSLVERDGHYEPKATQVDMSFSAGGDTQFVDLKRDGGDSIALGWPTQLPEPDVDGNTLTYPDVVPDGDLVVTALPTGFSHSIVLREAPTDSDLTIPVPVDLNGTTLKETSGGGLSIDSSDDKAVQAPAPLMWDSSTGAFGLPDNTEPVDATVTKTDGETTLVLTPDADMLADPNTKYPVTIDPTFTQTTPTSDTFVNSSGSYTSSNTVRGWDFMDTGFSNSIVGRSFLRYPAFDFTNKTVTSAELQARNVMSPGCTNGSTIAEQISSNWSESTLTWSNQPTVANNPSPPQYYLPHGGPSGSSCTAHDWAKWNVTGAVQSWASTTDPKPNYGFRLRAATENANSSWRRWRTVEGVTAGTGTTYYPKLVINYTVNAPEVSPLTIGPCDGCGADPVELSSPSPTLSAVGISGVQSQVRLDFEIYSGTDSTDVLKASGSVSADSGVEANWPAGPLEEDDYSARVRAFADGKFSSWSTWSHFNPPPASGLYDLHEGEPSVDDSSTDDTEDTPDPDSVEAGSQSDTASPNSDAGPDSVSVQRVVPFETKGDYVHYKPAEVAVSAHGWWLTSDPELSTKRATVTVSLQAYMNSKWKTVQVTAKRNLKPGTSKRGNAREKCSSIQTGVKWRSKVDVDIQGVVDGPGKYTSPTVVVYCTP